jgi:hypothetical protein
LHSGFIARSAACTNSYNVGQLCQFFKKVN